MSWVRRLKDWWYARHVPNRRCKAVLTEASRRIYTRKGAWTVDEMDAFIAWWNSELSQLTHPEQKYLTHMANTLGEFHANVARHLPLDADQRQELADAELQVEIGRHRVEGETWEQQFARLPPDLQERVRDWGERREGKRSVERLIRDAGGIPPGG